MVFSSVPLYLDPPNWQQHQNQLQGSVGNDENQHHFLPPMPEMGGGGGGAPRPNSMSERARLAKIPPPEAPLKCPRCDSSNTKFCYFNNYSLSQPRHFCKACRRYWTRGGALRSVPVGGGFRRNKRSSSASKSSSGTTSGGGVATSAASKPTSSSLTSVGDFMSSGGFVFPPSGGGTMTSFMASLQNMAHMGNLGLTSFGGIGGLGSSHHQSQLDNNFNNGSHLHGLFNHNNQIVPSPSPSPSSFLQGGFELPADVISTSSMVISRDDSRFPPVIKMEDNRQSGLNLAKQLMGISSSMNDNIDQNGNTNQFWGANIGNTTNMWTDLSSPHLQ